MKVFIVFTIFAATASASLIASPAIGYNAHGLGAGSSLVGGVRAISPVGVSYVSPIAAGHGSSGLVSPIGYGAGIGSSIGYGAGIGSSIGYGAQHVVGLGQLQQGGARLVSSIGYGAQHVAGLGQLQQGGARLVSSVPVGTALVSSPVLASVRTITPINAVHISPVAARVVAPVSGLNVHSVPLVSNVGASNLYSAHGSGLYSSGHLAKKL